ncbi:MAG: hypothetical protein J7515_07980 [Caulobacter sp.]|nr:hypothetical protein [Caulobacter sp.]
MTEHEALQSTVTEILDLLISHGDAYVVERLRAYRDRLEAGDPSVVQSLRSEATGSMGSLRDRYLSASNGDYITATEQEAVNARLGALVERLAEQTRP